MPFDDTPNCRVAIRDGDVTLNRWTPGLCRGGPERAGLRTVTAALADVHLLEDGELIVTPVPHAPWTAAAEEALLAWAATAGHPRGWLPDRVVGLQDALASLGPAAVDCPTGGAHWEDGTVAFWERVRAEGWFPGTCLACGGSLPEWTAQEGETVSERARLRRLT